MKKYILYIFLLGILFVYGGCDLINPEEEIPAYIYIDNFRLSTSGDEGSDSELITDAWLSVDGEFLGVFTLPAQVPVLDNGSKEIRVDAGIKDNGITDLGKIYPFYEPFITTLDLTANKTDTLRPFTTYSDDVQFTILEEFERTGHQFQEIRIGASNSGIEIDENNVFEGNSSGVLTLTPEEPTVEIASTTRFPNLTQKGFFVYIEVNYRSDVPVLFGLIGRQQNGVGTGTQLFEPGFLPSDTWNKIYFNISGLFDPSTFEEYQLVLQAFLPQENGQFTLTEGKVWLDNIKLLHL